MTHRAQIKVQHVTKQSLSRCTGDLGNKVKLAIIMLSCPSVMGIVYHSFPEKRTLLEKSDLSAD